MIRLVHNDNVRQDRSTYSPFMLVARKNPSLESIITDFKFLYSGLQIAILSFVLITDSFASLRSSKCKCLKVLDLKDGYHTIKLSDNSIKVVVCYFNLLQLAAFIKECPWD